MSERTSYLGSNVYFLRSRIRKEPAKQARNSEGVSVAAPPRRGAPNSPVMTQTDLAQILGCTQGHIGNMERGEAAGSILFLGKMAEFFGVTLDELLYEDLAGRAEKVEAA